MFFADKLELAVVSFWKRSYHTFLISISQFPSTAPLHFSLHFAFALLIVADFLYNYPCHSDFLCFYTSRRIYTGVPAFHSLYRSQTLSFSSFHTLNFLRFFLRWFSLNRHNSKLSLIWPHLNAQTLHQLLVEEVDRTTMKRKMDRTIHLLSSPEVPRTM